MQPSRSLESYYLTKKEISFLFESVAAIEKEHEERYKKLLDILKNSTVYFVIKADKRLNL